jgi:hypothetical protein
MSLSFLNKISLDKRKLTLLLALGKERLPVSPNKTESLWKQTPIPRALYSLSFRVPIKGALPPGSPHRASTERDAERFPKPSFVSQSTW